MLISSTALTQSSPPRWPSANWLYPIFPLYIWVFPKNCNTDLDMATLHWQATKGVSGVWTSLWEGDFWMTGNNWGGINVLLACARLQIPCSASSKMRGFFSTSDLGVITMVWRRLSILKLLIWILEEAIQFCRKCGICLTRI